MMYSSIEESERNEVIEKCYWPLLKLATIAPIGIEAPAITLEIIDKIDPEWIDTLKDLVSRGKVEFIGSGYSQIIGPLVPAKVNDWNQKIGLQIYDEILGVQPKIALINEMAYSAGVVEHYLNNDYKAIVMEWNNPRKYHSEWSREWQYHPQTLRVDGERTLKLIWADSIAFQKFQRYVHGEMSLDKYMNYLASHIGSEARLFPLYSSDAEIFDYRPGRYKTEHHMAEGESEWKRIADLFTRVQEDGCYEFVSLDDDLFYTSNPNSGNHIALESLEQPIPVKKQEKYNINRWALSGRGDQRINTDCFGILSSMTSDSDITDADKIELCYLFSSDFRTHITQERWEAYLTRLSRFKAKWPAPPRSRSEEGYMIKSLPFGDERYQVSLKDTFINVRTDKINLFLNPGKGNVLHSCQFLEHDDGASIGSLEHGYYEDISFSADYFTGHTVIEPLAKHKISDLGRVTPDILRSEHGLVITSDQSIGNMMFDNHLVIGQDSFTIKKKIRLEKREPVTIHPFHVTILPESWDLQSLYIKVNNGGYKEETFLVGYNPVNHKMIHSPLISSIHGMGVTSGTIAIGDKRKKLSITHDQSQTFICPRILFIPFDGKRYFFRIVYSAQEIDETFREDVLPQEFDLSFHISMDSSRQ